ncbi:MAG: ABC transporter ATP-binding protein [Pirellula sp.]
MTRIVEVSRLCKQYGNFAALHDCDLAIDRGIVFGLLGPNGAGKTTLIRCLLGFLRPSSGTASIDGLDCVHESLLVRQRISYLPAESKLFRTMRGRDCIEFFSAIHPLGNRNRAIETAKRLELDTSRRVAYMSTGMRQKLAISCVLSCESPLMILDEPTANLDPTVRGEVLAMVREANARGTTVVFCSHVLDEIEDICHHAAVMKQGKVVRCIDLYHHDLVHRIRAKTGPNVLPTIPEQHVRWLQRESTIFVFEIDGPLETHLLWLATSGLESIQIESVGLRSLYDAIHPGPFLSEVPL